MKLNYKKTIDYLGKIMLGWFVFTTVIYFYSGRFSAQVDSLSGNYDLWSIYTLIQIPVAAFGIFIIIPFLLKGNIIGISLGLIYWVCGYCLNPLWYIVPRSMQFNSDGTASILLCGINSLYSIASLLLLILFYLQRRSDVLLSKST